MNNGLLLTIILEIMSIAFFAGIYVATIKHQKELMTRIEKSFHEKFESLEKKQDKHNSVIERTYCVERDNSVLKEQIKVMNHRIEDLEKRNENC